MRKSLTWAAIGTTVAAAMLSAAGTASASTAPAKTATTLTAAASSTSIVAGKTATIGGDLKTAAGKPVDDAVVWLEQEYKTKSGTEAFRKVEAKSTGSAKSKTVGEVSFTVRPLSNTIYELHYDGSRTYDSATSATDAITVNWTATTLTATTSATSVAKDKAVTVKGILDAGTTGVSGQWVTLLQKVSYTVKVTVKVNGKTETKTKTKTKWVPVENPAKTNSTGVATFRAFKPVKTATYELSFATKAPYTGSVSSAFTITVTK